VAGSKWKKQVHIRDNYTCQNCGNKEDPKHLTFQCHHIIWKCHGGSSSLDNLKLLCPKCHDVVHKVSPRRKKKKKKHRKKHYPRRR